MTKAEAVSQARASSAKLQCDPDLVELMAIRLWDAAINSAASVADKRDGELREYLTLVDDIIESLGGRSVPTSVVPTINGLMRNLRDIQRNASDWARATISDIHKLK